MITRGTLFRCLGSPTVTHVQTPRSCLFGRVLVPGLRSARHYPGDPVPACNRSRLLRPAPPPAAGRGGLDNQVAPGADFSPKPPVVRLSPEEQQKRFLLPPGYRIEPVLADPQIEDPVGVTFDGNGRMYVLEMRSYMQDADGSNSRAPISRISRHEDTDGDGTYDRHTVFADKLVLPRIALSARGRRHPGARDRQPRHLQVHRHQRRRRRGQEGAVLLRASAASRTWSGSRAA